MSWALPVLLAVLGPVSVSSVASASPESRPNVVVLLTDDQSWQSLGVAGDPSAVTPSIDRLAEGGIRFANAFVTTSLCSPSRASILTGQYVRTHGVVGNNWCLHPGTPTFATALAAAGYDTGYFGKWHMGEQRDRPGFRRTGTFHAQGTYVGATFDVDGVTTPTTGWVDDVSTDYAISFIREERDRPFLLFLGFKGPHAPCRPPLRHLELEIAGDLDVPANAWALPPFPRIGERRRLEQAAEKTRHDYETPENWLDVYDGERKTSVTDARRRAYMRAYYRTLAAVDENVGRVLDALTATGVADDTLVLFTSDNGQFLGEHGLYDKRAAYEESIRVPLVARYPRIIAPGSVSDALVLNVDLAPTILDLAGAPALEAANGRSLRPLMEGKKKGWRESFLYEYFRVDFTTPSVCAVRTADWKLIVYPKYPSWTELFDLTNDPLELTNLANDDAHADRRRELEELLRQLDWQRGSRPSWDSVRRR